MGVAGGRFPPEATMQTARIAAENRLSDYYEPSNDAALKNDRRRAQTEVAADLSSSACSPWYIERGVRTRVCSTWKAEA